MIDVIASKFAFAVVASALLCFKNAPHVLSGMFAGSAFFQCIAISGMGVILLLMQYSISSVNLSLLRVGCIREATAFNKPLSIYSMIAPPACVVFFLVDRMIFSRLRSDMFAIGCSLSVLPFIDPCPVSRCVFMLPFFIAWLTVAAQSIFFASFVKVLRSSRKFPLACIAAFISFLYRDSFQGFLFANLTRGVQSVRLSSIFVIILRCCRFDFFAFRASFISIRYRWKRWQPISFACFAECGKAIFLASVMIKILISGREELFATPALLQRGIRGYNITHGKGHSLSSRPGMFAASPGYHHFGSLYHADAFKAIGHNRFNQATMPVGT